MPADTNKKSDIKNVTSSIKVGSDGSKHFHKLRKPSNPGKKLVLLSLPTLLIIILFGHFGLHIGQKVYAQAAGHKIYKKDVDGLINGQKISEHQAATVLANRYLAQAMAKKQKITVSEKDIEKAYGPNINREKHSNKYSYQLLVNQLYFNKLQAYNQGVYKGKLLVTNFSRYVAYNSPLLAEQKAGDPNIGNPEAIAKDKQYAQHLINSLYDQLVAHRITFDQAIVLERNDPIVGEKAYPSLEHSGVFDTSSPYPSDNSLIQTSSIQKQMHNIRSGQLSKPFVVRVPNSIDNQSEAESYFLVVKMDYSKGGNNGTSFNQELSQAKKELGYKVNV